MTSWTCDDCHVCVLAPTSEAARRQMDLMRPGGPWMPEGCTHRCISQVPQAAELTKRELFAAVALHALLNNSTATKLYTGEVIAKEAVDVANDMMRLLSKPAEVKE